MGGGTLREVHDQTTETTGISHRETTHTYLQRLTDAGLVEKSECDSEGIYYQVAKTTIDLHLLV